jgi:osmotically-inducible protein OsmY
MKIALVLLAFVSFGCLSGDREPKSNNYLDDKVIAARVQQLLHNQTDYKYPDTHVAVTNGVVHLTGSVQTPNQKLKAANLAKGVEKVRSLNNNLTLKPKP